MTNQLAWILTVAVALTGCEKQGPANASTAPATQNTPAKQDPAKPRTVEERIADILADGAFASEERARHEQALSRILYQAPHEQFMADFHRLLLKEGQSLAGRDSHTELLKTMVAVDTRPGVINSFVSKHFSTCEGVSFENGRVNRFCKRGNGQPAADPLKGCRDYLALMIPPLVGLDQLDEKGRAMQGDLIPLVEQYTGKKKEELPKDTINNLLPLVQKHRPDAYDRLAAVINGMKADTRARKQESIRAELRKLHRKELQFYVQKAPGKEKHVYWTGDAGGLLDFEPKETDAPAKPYESGAYLISPLLRDAKGVPYGQEIDGNGKPRCNKEGFSYVAVPKDYPDGGRQTYLLNETGNLWSMDTGGKAIDVFPANLEADGWVVAEKPVSEDDLATLLFKHALEQNDPDDMRVALSVMKKRGEDVSLLLLTLLRQQEEVRKRVLPVCAAEFEGSEDPRFSALLETSCAEVWDPTPVLDALRRIAPKAHSGLAARFRQRLLECTEEGKLPGLIRAYGAADKAPDWNGLAREWMARAKGAVQDGKYAQADLFCTAWLSLPNAGSTAEYAQAYRLRAKARLGKNNLQGAQGDVEAARNLIPAMNADEEALEAKFPELPPLQSPRLQKVTATLKRGDLEEAGYLAQEVVAKAAAYPPAERREFARILVESGKARSAKGDRFGAESMFDDALKFHPTFTQAFLERCRMNVRSKYEDAALSDFEQLKQLDPALAATVSKELAQAFLERGRKYRREKVELLVLENFEKAKQLDPELGATVSKELAEDYLERGRKYLNEKVDLLVVEYFEKAKQQDPELAGTAVKEFVPALLRVSRFAESKVALKLLDTIIAADPAAARAWLGRAIRLKRNGDFAGYLADFEKAMDRCGSDGEARKECAQEFLLEYRRIAREDWALVLRLTGKAILLFEKPPAEVIALRGELRWRTGDIPGADADYREAAKTDPKWLKQLAAVYVSVSDDRLVLGDRVGAMAALQKAHDLFPDLYKVELAEKSSKDWAKASKIYRDQDRMKEALAAIDLALQTEPGVAEHHASRSNILAEMGDWPASLSAISKAIEIVPKHAGNWLTRAYSRGLQHDDSGSMADYAECLRLNSEAPAAYYYRGSTHRLYRRWKEAASDFEQYVAKGGSNSAMLALDLWDVWQRLGEPKKADLAVETMLAQVPRSGAGWDLSSYLAGQQTEESLWKLDGSKDENATRYYFISRKLFYKGDRAGALNRLEKCRDAKSVHFPEWYLKPDFEEVLKGK